MKRTLFLFLITSAFIARSQDPGLVLHQPAMDKVIVEEGKKFMTANDTTLVFDIYYPQGFDKKQQLPVVVFVNGVGNMELHRWKIYKDWGRLVAANGLIAVTYQTRRNHAADDSERILDYIGAHARELSIDKEKMGLWSCSANVTTGLPLAMKESRSNIKALVVYYGSAPLEASALRQDLEMQIVRAGLDFYNLNVGIESFVKMALTEDLHFEYINYPEGQHAFDAFDDTPRSREIILQTIDFLKRVLAKDHPQPTKAVMTNSRLWNMIVVEKKVDEALKERKAAADMYSKMPNHSPWYNHLIDERNLNQMGYQLIEAGRVPDALKVFEANREQFPQSANAYDALADAYEKVGDKQKAVLNATKALEKLAAQTNLQPQMREAIKQSAEDKIKRLQ
jgi:tetratricopeptide (TPR) repeat protein